MAFDRTNLSGNLGAGSNAPKIFTFRDDASTIAQIATADYFLGVYSLLEAGDVIQATGSNGTTNVAVTASSSTTVTVADVVPSGGVLTFGPSAVTSITVTNGIVTAIS